MQGLTVELCYIYGCKQDQPEIEVVCDLLSCLDHGDSVLGLGSACVLSGYYLGQLCVREVCLTYSPEV